MRPWDVQGYPETRDNMLYPKYTMNIQLKVKQYQNISSAAGSPALVTALYQLVRFVAVCILKGAP